MLGCKECSVAHRYRRLGRTCSLQLQGGRQTCDIKTAKCTSLCRKSLAVFSAQRVPAGTAWQRSAADTGELTNCASNQSSSNCLLCSQHPSTGHIYSETRVFGRHVASCSLIDVYRRFGRSCRPVTGTWKHKITPNCFA